MRYEHNRVVLGDGFDNILVFARTVGTTKRENGTYKTVFEEKANQLPLTEKQRAEYSNPDNDKNGEGGGSFVYSELGASNSIFADRIEAAPDMAALQSTHADMKDTGYLRYDVDLSAFDADDFAALPLEDAKRVLMDCLELTPPECDAWNQSSRCRLTLFRRRSVAIPLTGRRFAKQIGREGRLFLCV